MTAPTLPDVAKVETAIVEMTNDFRAKYKLAGVKPDTKLTNAARAFAQHLARTGAFAHNGDGREPSERAFNAGYSFCFIAENLALNQSSAGFESRDLARQMVEGWINSPGHRKNLLAEHATDTAVAIAKGPERNPKYIAVQLFGRPKSLAYEFQVSNSTSGPIHYSFGGKTHELKPGVAAIHTACTPDEVAFDAAITSGTATAARPAVARYETRDGQIFVLEKAAGGYRVVVNQKERLAPRDK